MYDASSVKCLGDSLSILCDTTHKYEIQYINHTTHEYGIQQINYTSHDQLIMSCTVNLELYNYTALTDSKNITAKVM